MSLNLKIKITSLIITFFSFTGWSFAAQPAAFIGQISADGINVRVDATVSSEVICVLPKGRQVEVVAEVYDWYKIRLPQEAPAYLKKDLVECMKTDPNVNPGKCLSAKVIKDRINVRLSPSESGWILGKIDKLTVVSVLSEEKGWYKIQPVYQSFGWVNKKFISKDLTPLAKKEEVPPAVIVKETPSSIIVEGEVFPYGVVLWRKATHKLITSDNKIYFLKGDRKGLNSLNYRKVKVTGKLITPPETKNPIIEVGMIEVAN